MTTASKPGAPTSAGGGRSFDAELLTRAILEQAAEAILVCDPSGVIVRASRAAVALAGRNCLGEQFATAFPIEIAGIGRPERLVARVIAGESFPAVDARLAHSDSGGVRWLLISAGPLRSNADVGCVVSMVDITARKLVQDDLRSSEERYRALVDLAPDAMLVHQGGRIAYANSAALRLFGAASAEELTGTEILSRIHPDDVELVLGRMRFVERGGVAPLHEIRMLRLDGAPLEVETTAATIEFARRPAVQLVVRDIGERKRAAAALAEREALVRALIENATDPVYVKSRDSRILLANPALARVVGKPVESILGLSDAECYGDPAAGRTLREHDLAVMDAGRALTVEETVPTPEGPRTFLSAKAPYRNAAGEVVGTVGISRDVTDRKRAEAFAAAVNAVHSAVLSTRDADEVMKAVLAEGARALGCDTAAISLREGGHWVARHALGFSADVIGVVMTDDEERHAVLAERLRKPVAVDDALEDGRVNRDHLRKWGIRSVLVVPLFAHGEVAGVVFFNYQRRRVTFTDLDVDFALRIAAATSLALENARLFAELQRELSERRLTEDALARGEARYRTLVETANEGVWVTDADQRTTYVNRAMAVMLGCSPEEMIGRRPTDFVPESSRGIVAGAAERRRKGVSESLELQLVRRDGTPLWVISNAAPLLDAGGAFAGTVGMLTDITERKRAEELVSQGQTTFAELVERAPFGIYVVDSDFRVAQMNAGSQEGAFRNVRPVIGRDFSEAMRILWPEPVAAEIIATFRRTLETGEAYYSPRFTNPRHDVGTVESYEWELHRLKLPNGRFGVICYYFDSTRLREAEAALRASEARYRDLFQNMAEEAYVWELVRDEQGRITTWRLVDANPPALATWGKAIEEIRGRTTDEIFGAGAAEHYRPVVERIMSERAPHSYEDYFPNLDRYFRFTSVPLGELFITTGADITAIRKSVEALRASEQRLRRFYDSGLVGVIYWTTDGRITDANDRFLAMTGYAREDLAAGRIDWLGMSPPEYRHLDEASMTELMAAGVNAAPFEKEYVRKDGTRLPVVVAGAMLDEARTEGVAFVLDVTQRKRAESERERLLADAASRAAELEAILEAQANAVLTYDPDRKVQRTNPSFRTTYGFDPVGLDVAEILGRVACRNLDGTPIALERQPTPRALRGEATPSAFYRVRRGDGTEAIIETSSSPLRAGGRLAGAVTAWHDCTRRIEAEDALRVAEERFAVAFANNPAAIALTRLEDGVFRDVNDTWVSLNGYAREEAIGRSARTMGIWPEPGDAARFVAELERTGSVRGWEQAFRRKSGELFTAQLSAQILRVRGEDLILSTFVDISERKAVEDRLRRAGLEWERTFDAVPDLIAILDENFRIVRANRAMAERLGTQPEACAGLTCFACVHGISEPHAACPHVLTLADGKEHVAEIHEPRLHGDFMVSTTPLTGADGRPIGSVHVARDITERKRAEVELRDRAEELRAANEELERFNRAMVGRELRMIDLKREVNALCARLGEPAAYAVEAERERRR